MEFNSTKFTTISHYEELELKAQHNQIELANCIKNQYSHLLTSNGSQNQNPINNKMVIATMCIQDLWRWINEIGIKAIRNNEYLQSEINEIQYNNESQRNQWEQFCAELENTNINLKNENQELKIYLNNMQQTSDTMLNEYRDTKNQNETLLNQLEHFKDKYNEIQNTNHQFQQEICTLNQTVNNLKTKKRSMIIEQHKQNMTQFMEIKRIIESSLTETQIPLENSGYINISNENTDNDTIALLCQIIKNQDHKLITFRNEINGGISKMNLELSEYQNQHYCPYDGEQSFEDMKSIYGEDDNYSEYDDNIYDEFLNEFKYKLCQLFVKYELIEPSKTTIDWKSSLDLIENVCNDLNKYKNSYLSANNQIQKLKQRLGPNSRKKRKKSCPNKAKQHRSCPIKANQHRVIKSKCGRSIAMIDPIQILSEITDDLLSLMKYLQIVQNNNQYEYCINKIESLSSSLQDVANDIGSPLLQNAVNILKSLRNNICNNSGIYKFNNNSMHDIINQTKNRIADLYNSNVQSKPQHKSVSISRIQMNKDAISPESLSEIMNNNEMYLYDAPFIQSIKIDGNWFHKTAKAVIVYKGNKYRRNVKAFEWLHNMLALTRSNRDIPQLQRALSRNEWHCGYLKKRRRELNKFLKECHRTKWIRQFEVYNKIFFAKSCKEWKFLRNKFNRNVISRIKDAH